MCTKMQQYIICTRKCHNMCTKCNNICTKTQPNEIISILCGWHHSLQKLTESQLLSFFFCCFKVSVVIIDSLSNVVQKAHVCIESIDSYTNPLVLLSRPMNSRCNLILLHVFFSFTSNLSIQCHANSCSI